MKMSKIPIPDDTMLVEIVTDTEFDLPNHMVYCLNEEVEVIESIEIEEASVMEVTELIPHMVVIQFTPKDVFDMMCGYKIRAGHIFEPDFYPYDHTAWRYFLDKEMLYIIREFAKLNNVANYASIEEYKEKYHRIDDYTRRTPIEKENDDVHLRMVKARKYQLDIIRTWVL